MRKGVQLASPLEAADVSISAVHLQGACSNLNFLLLV